jgi:hypothetical protein
MAYRGLRYGTFAAGLLVAAMSFLVCVANGLAGEGAGDDVTRATFLCVVAGSAIAGGAILTGAVLSRRFVPLAAVLLGGLAGAVAGRSSYRLGYVSPVGEWMLALLIVPVGMWLGWLGGASRSRVMAGAALGGAGGALLAALAFPTLFNSEGPPINDDFWALVGLLAGGLLGSLVGALVGWSSAEKEGGRLRESGATSERGVGERPGPSRRSAPGGLRNARS